MIVVSGSGTLSGSGSSGGDSDMVFWANGQPVGGEVSGAAEFWANGQPIVEEDK